MEEESLILMDDENGEKITLRFIPKRDCRGGVYGR